jgi:RiboL-PSP-HEPN
MSKARMQAELADQLDSDLTWRLRELSDLKAAIANSQKHARSVLLRSVVTMLYAHWEGHIRYCANKYFEYVMLRKHRYNELEKQLYINNFLMRLDALQFRRGNVEDRCRLISDVLNSAQKRFSRINPALIETKSNLNSDILKDICTICSIDFSYFQTKRVFIDVILLKRRNSIAHGEDTFVDSKELDTLIAEGVALMRSFKDALQNKVYTKSYLAAGR